MRPLAIVGRGAVLPGALDPAALWSAVRAGEDLTSEVDPHRWRVPLDSVDTRDRTHSTDRTWTRQGGYVRGFQFDPTGYALPPEELVGLGDLHHWTLTAGRQALAESGVSGPVERGALVLGNLSFPSAELAAYAEHAWLGERASGTRPDARARFSSGLPAHLAARALGLGGPAFALDAACASSLYAIHYAADLLSSGAVDLALAGAVCCADDLFIHIGFCALQAMSTSGRSRPFHARADGLIPAEGAGIVVLRRLEDALRDGQRVLGVIRGIGLSNDGRGRHLLAPSAQGQARALRAAWKETGLSPATLGMVECHATGTPVGDATELESMAAAFGPLEAPLPLGSLKSNLGHLVTAAGVAGLLKVLGALEEGVRPPTLHIDEPTRALQGKPFRLIRELEAWEGPRRASVSAFGFGGNNAHLVVEDLEETLRDPAMAPFVGRAPMVPVGLPPGEIAVVGVGARVGGLECAAALQSLLVQGQPLSPSRTESVHLSLQGLRFPPRDLQLAIGQQTAMLAAAIEAAAMVGTLPTERTGAWVGMGCDAEVARYGARWRLQGDPLLRDALAPGLEAQGVVGTMPNIPANRLNAQLDIAGPSHTISSEELSGIRALQIAMRALRAGELEAAVVGAVDLSCEPVHEEALAALVGAVPPADAAVALILKRRDVAERDGDRILALLDEAGPVDAEWRLDAARGPLTDRLGHAHAASGLLHVLSAVLAAAAGQYEGAPLRAVGLDLNALGGQSARLRVAALPGAAPIALEPQMSSPPHLTLPAHLPPVPRSEVQRMAPAPILPSVSAAGPAAPLPSVAAPTAPPEAMPSAPPMGFPSPALAALAGHQAMVGQVHQQFLASQAALQTQIMAMHQASMASLVAAAAARRGGWAASHPVGAGPGLNRQDAKAPRGHWPVEAVAGNGQVSMQPTPSVPPRPTPAVSEMKSGRPMEPRPSRDPTNQASSARSPSTRPPTSSPPASPPPSAPSWRLGALAVPNKIAAPPTRKAHVPSPTPALPPPGVPTFDKAALRIHAGGNISEIFGPEFKAQDAYQVVCRMPEPPLLLADRCTGVVAEKNSMGTGAMWTETDVGEDSWYMHHGRMPAGLMIESGQADLMLISYLGIDLLVKGERRYRLLGCEGTWHGPLPKPGDTLVYDIHVDGHARQGNIRLFFFHYDCRVNGEPRLTVRNGQAGFFTEAELGESMGVLWDAETGEHEADAQVDPPRVSCSKTAFSTEDLAAFAQGDTLACFGPGFELTAAHTRTPHIAPGRMRFLEEVTHFDPKGGPWGRGYLRAIDPIAPDDWFFTGHFKNDPCMPGTLMFEGCLQAMAVYLTALGYSIDKDGWRFEPVPLEPYLMRCRGQVDPGSSLLVYEIFVEEVHDGPMPTVFADLLCTVDGLKAFHCRRMGLRLVPDWPLEAMPEWQAKIAAKQADEAARGVEIATIGAHRLDYKALLSCAWGKPSDAFGPMYQVFDGARRTARLPGPPYHFLDRISKVTGDPGRFEAGATVEVAYDLPPDVWYFRENGAAVMPYAVLLEAALQPCGWLASYVGSTLTTDKDLLFRNLDGTGTVHVDVLPESGTLTTRVRCTNLSKSAGMLIEGFEVVCSLGDVEVYTLKTVFGFFPPESFQNQAGLPTTPELRARLTEAGGETVDLRPQPARYFGGSARLPAPMLRMIDRVTGWWPEGGAAGLGRLVVEKDVDPHEWMFKAHFYQDPVQPGSLGIEAMIAALQWAMLARGMDAALPGGRFQAIATGRPMTWKYRGQVVPTSKIVSVTMDLTEVGVDERGPYAFCECSLWVDGKRIYEAKDLGMRIVAGDDRIDPAGWIRDHRPTHTVPALPMMSMVHRLLAAGGPEATGLDEVQVLGWTPVNTTVTTVTRRVTGNVDKIELLADDKAIAIGSIAQEQGSALSLAELEEPTPQPDPYAAGHLFHGPAFQILTHLEFGRGGARATLDAGRASRPEILLDGLTHAIPHDRLHLWFPDVAEDQVAYPSAIPWLRLHGPTPTSGEVTVEVRAAGRPDTKTVAFELVASTSQGPWLSMRLVERLFPKGPIGCAPPLDRLAFLRDHRAVDGLRLSEEVDALHSRLDPRLVAESDWLRGTVDATWALPEGLKTGARASMLLAKEHVAAQLGQHPSRIEIHGDLAIPTSQPLTAWPFEVARDGAELLLTQTGPPALRLDPVVDFWSRWFGLGRWPTEDLYYGLIQRYIGAVYIEDPDAFQSLRGRSCLYLANHQTMLESLVFSILVGGLSGVPTVTLAKIEHQITWLGKLIAHSFAWPGAKDPQVIAFFDREDKASLPKIIGQLAREMAGPGKSLLVHVEGTRAKTCRKPVEKMSGAFLDMALKIGVPVIPVRFTGGLPSTPMEKRTDFPFGHGRQDIWVGRPIMPEQLARIPYGPRKQLVVDAINALGPSNAVEEASPSDPVVAESVGRWMAQAEVTAPYAAIWRVIEGLADREPWMQRLVVGGQAGALSLPDTAEGRWIAELGRWILGERAEISLRG